MKKKPLSTALALCFEITAKAQDGAYWLPVVPKGEFTGRDGRQWVNNNPDGIIAAFNSELPFDVEHATQVKGASGDPAPAYGWIKALENRAGEVWANVAFNDEGQSLIDGKKYKFYSPAFYYTSDGHVVAMHSAGLTNKPNLDLLALNSEMENDPVKLPLAITVALGLNTECSETDAVTAITKLKSDHQLALNKEVDLTKFVPTETHELALNRAKTAEERLAGIDKAEQEQLVDSAIKTGKVAPANKEMYLAVCRTEEGREQFTKMVGSAAPVVDKDKKKTKAPAGEVELEEHELAMCRSMNMKPEEFIAAKKLTEGNQ